MNYNKPIQPTKKRLINTLGGLAVNNNVYININDFEVFVRKHFDKIINGEGLTIPRQIVGYAIDEIFQEGEQQVIHRSGEHYLEISLRKE